MCLLVTNVYYIFQNEHHVIRRSDRYWSVPSTDIITLASKHYTGEQYQSIEQYRDMGKTGRTRDMKDTYKVPDALKQWTPLQPTHRSMVW